LSVLASFKQVSKSFGDHKALNGISFDVKAGQLLAFLGPNGAGKSTTMSLLIGLRSPDSGQVELFRQSPRDYEVRRRIGVTPQDLAFPPLLTVGELIQFVAAHHENPRPYQWVLKQLGLSEFENRKTAGMSGGEKRRLGVALALVGNPDLIVLDEPTTGLDIESRRGLWSLIQELMDEGKTIVLTTHYLEEVEALADRVLVIDKGQLIFDGSVEQIKSKVDLRKISFATPIDVSPWLKASQIVSWSCTGNRYTLVTEDSDRLVRELIRNDTEFLDLSVELVSLEEAFMALREKSG
jgi:ABC-2 type transport system ATP-binding protein